MLTKRAQNGTLCFLKRNFENVWVVYCSVVHNMCVFEIRSCRHKETGEILWIVWFRFQLRRNVMLVSRASILACICQSKNSFYSCSSVEYWCNFVGIEYNITWSPNYKLYKLYFPFEKWSLLLGVSQHIKFNFSKLHCKIDMPLSVMVKYHPVKEPTRLLCYNGVLV